MISIYETSMDDIVHVCMIHLNYMMHKKEAWIFIGISKLSIAILGLDVLGVHPGFFGNRFPPIPTELPMSFHLTVAIVFDG